VTAVSRVVAIGEESRIQGFALAGVTTCPTERKQETCAAWRALSDETAVVILTPSAADHLAGQLDRRPDVLTVVMPP
jgi:vacuolar-type H+-ATPase subunit F/Vma7